VMESAARPAKLLTPRKMFSNGAPDTVNLSPVGRGRRRPNSGLPEFGN
jgi:hypothetical protein